MDQFDQAFEKICNTDQSRHGKLVSILILGVEQKTTGSLCKALEVNGDVVECVKTMKAFEKILSQESVDIVIVATGSTKTQRKKVFDLVSRLAPDTPVVGFSTTPNHKTTVEFIRNGGIDVFCLPSDLQVISSRVRAIVERAFIERAKKNKATLTSKLCNEINKDRHRVEEENNILSGDLANSFCDTKRKMQQVAIGAEFRTLVNQELDVESMLRTSLGYMLTRLGSLNAAVFLREGEVDWAMGAFVNFDRLEDRFQSLLETLGQAACPVIASDHQLKRFTDGESFADLMGIDPIDYVGSEVISFGCCYKNRCMAVMVLFREDTRPFESEAIDTIDTIRSIFGQQLATIATIHRRAQTHWPSESIDDDDWTLGKAA